MAASSSVLRDTPPEVAARAEFTPVRVTYYDTDQMGHVYYSKYLVWFEMGRTEWLRARGGCYREMEEGGVYLPVAEAHCEYLRPAFYDDLLTIVTWVAEVRRVSLRFAYEIRCESRGELLARGYTRHGFVSRERKIVRADDRLLALLTSGIPAESRSAAR